MIWQNFEEIPGKRAASICGIYCKPDLWPQEIFLALLLLVRPGSQPHRHSPYIRTTAYVITRVQMTDPTSRQRGRPTRDRTVTFKQDETSGHAPQSGLDTKADKLTDRQLQCDCDCDSD
jgi:hypothetical protein